MADPDLELRGVGGGRLDFLALLTFFPSVISSFFAQNKGGGGGLPGLPSPRSATGRSGVMHLFSSGYHKYFKVKCKSSHVYMLFAGREVRIGKNCPRGPRAVLKTEGTVFPNTDRRRPANNVFIFFSSVEYFVSSFCVEFSLQPFSNLVYACV